MISALLRMEGFLEVLILTLRSEGSLEINMGNKEENVVLERNSLCKVSIIRGRMVRVKGTSD